MSKQTLDIKLLFSDHFNVSPKIIEEYGAFNISLVSDLPLFIDPFLLFNSSNPTYQSLHKEIITYLEFLKSKSSQNLTDKGLISAWYKFPEVYQNWFGFSIDGNKGRGLGKDFANALNNNFYKLFPNYGEERVTSGTHLEKLCLVKDGVGRDNISDFTTNLIKDYLAQYTQAFCKKYLDPNLCDNFNLQKSIFNYKTEVWESKKYYLPSFKGDFILITPKDILTKDEVWINKTDLIDDFEKILISVSNEELRSQLNNYLFKKLGTKNITKKKKKETFRSAILEHPEFIDYYIKYKEDNGNLAQDISSEKVAWSEELYLDNFKNFVSLVNSNTSFYNLDSSSYKAALERAKFLKHVIEDCDGYRIFYINKNPVGREEDLKILYKMTWYASEYDFNTEVNNGRGPADAVVSKGSKDKSIAEFKLASNSKLEENLLKQAEIYKKASQAQKTLKIILCFTKSEQQKVTRIIKRNGWENEDSIVTIDARNDNKPSASKA